jgi:hypothetical protein
MDPPIAKLCRPASIPDRGLEWEFYMIPSCELKPHHELANRFKSLQSFRYSELQKYKIVDWAKTFS